MPTLNQRGNRIMLLIIFASIAVIIVMAYMAFNQDTTPAKAPVHEKTVSLDKWTTLRGDRCSLIFNRSEIKALIRLELKGFMKRHDNPFEALDEAEDALDYEMLRFVYHQPIPVSIDGFRCRLIFGKIGIDRLIYIKKYLIGQLKDVRLSTVVSDWKNDDALFELLLDEEESRLFLSISLLDKKMPSSERHIKLVSLFLNDYVSSVSGKSIFVHGMKGTYRLRFIRIGDSEMGFSQDFSLDEQSMITEMSSGVEIITEEQPPTTEPEEGG